MSEPIDPVLQTVVVSAKRPVSDDVTILVNGQIYGGWQDVRITRGIERLPSDFELRLTDFFNVDGDLLQIKAGDACVVKIGPDTAITGYVDIVMISLTRDEHEITVMGRSKCADLVDCSAVWAGGQISGASAFECAAKLADPFGIKVTALGDPGLRIPSFNLMLGETPFDIVERLCRYSELLTYDDVDGNLVLSRVSKTEAASGFRQGVNVQSATATFSMHDRFSQYECYPNALDTLQDLGDAGFGNLSSFQLDAGVPRIRTKIFISDGTGLGGADVAKRRAGWEASRRYGRSYAVRLNTDSWRDVQGALYAPNTLVGIDLPTLKISGKKWTISEITYRKTAQGTVGELVIMPPQAFDVAPTAFQPALPADVSSLPAGLGVR